MGYKKDVHKKGRLAAAPCLDIGGTYFDAAICANVVCPGCPGDLDGDGDTDAFDFTIFAPDFGCGTGP